MTQLQTKAPVDRVYTSSVTQARPPLFVAQLPAAKTGGRHVKRVLITNRGEIACRIIATCKKLNLTSIAIYAEEDATSLHVSQADEAISLGSIGQAGGNPFLNVSLLVSVAQSAKADAIHPGYGYLSENGEFAEAVRQAGIIFVGPSSQAMSTLGDKRNSKEYLRQHEPSVPLIPGFTGSSQSIEDLEAAAEEIGFPVMLKASAGGGGRGMRIVRERSDLKGELERAQSEAQRSFGSSDCILEKYIESAKHVEVQIIGDSHGKVLSLWERECSVQRRHQKVIEESPSPFLNAEQRQRICATAVRIGELIGYEGAGTVEFVVNTKDGSFYFLEVNTRLQVEHPITEEITGLDIVALQLFAAAGGSFASLPVLQQIPQHGHAIECRLCAEDPGRDFTPEHGTIRLWKEAEIAKDSRDIRYETAIQSGAKVSIHFDSMIAKIVVWAPTRELAISKMAKVMANTVCMGVRTNQLFLQSCLLHSSFHDPAYTTSLIPTHLPSLIKNPYSQQSHEMTSMLSVIPGILQRDSRFIAAHGTNKVFKHVRRGFRNQHFDPLGLDSSIIVPVDPVNIQKPLVSVWKPSSASVSAHVATLLPVPDLEISKDEVNANKSTAYQLSRRYNALSNLLRGGTVNPTSSYEVQVQKWTVIPLGEGWLAANIEVRINNSRIHAHIATSTTLDTSCAGHQAILCHFPALGTWTSYECHSLLSYFESLRSAVEASTGTASKIIKAPMPCKVLSVLKKNGDDVKVGEIVMVIESMKMETNIAVAADGKFKTSVKQGDAVDDGKVLCSVE